MKKLFSTTLACIFAAMTMSCNNAGNGSDAASATTDTISYIVGMNMGKNIENVILPQLKADYDVIVATLEKGLNGEESFKVGDITIDKNNIQELGMKYLGPEISIKVQKAMADSTGQTEVFDNPTDKEIASTLLGADYAFGLEKAPFDVDAKSVIKGINDNHNNTLVITEEKAQDFMMNYFQVVIPAENKKLSDEWLAAIEKENGVQKTESGILYKIVNEGDMNTKATNDTDVVKVLYTGKTRKDIVFDSNRWADIPEQRKTMITNFQPENAGKDNPIEFPLNGVIKGWTEGMKLVGKGGRIQLWIPAELAYGERGAGQDIGPNEALFFDVELLEVKAAK